MSEAHQTVYAVVRFDRYPGIDPGELRNRVTVKEVLWSQDLAEREVERLNRLNADRGCRYFWQATRLFPPGSSAGDGGAA